MPKCPYCGSTAQFKILDVIMCDTYVEITYRCGCSCGTKITTRLTKEQYKEVAPV